MHGPIRIRILNIFFIHMKGTQRYMCAWSQRNPAVPVCMKPKPHTRRECGRRFHPLLHTSYIMDYWSAPLSEDVFSGCYVQQEGQSWPWIVSYWETKVWSLHSDWGPSSNHITKDTGVLGCGAVLCVGSEQLPVFWEITVPAASESNSLRAVWVRWL